MRHILKGTATLALAALALGVTACGDDDSDTDDAAEETTTTVAEGDTAAFCDALLEFNDLANNAEVGEESSEEEVKAAGEELAPVFQRVVDNAPDELADQAEALNDDAIKPLLDGEGEAFGADETFEKYTELTSGAAEPCAFESAAVTAVDYAFEGVPATLTPGVYSIELTNASDAEQHEMVIARKADGVTQSFDEILDMSEEESDSLIEFRGAGFAAPGESATALIDLDEAGDYIMVCFVPVGGAEDGPPHFTQGMKAEFKVA